MDQPVQPDAERIIAQLDDGVVVLDAAGVIVACNQAAARLLPPGHPPTGQPLAVLDRQLAAALLLPSGQLTRAEGVAAKREVQSSVDDELDNLETPETKQIREVRTIFDWVTRKARYIDKKINDEQQLEEKNEEWDIPDYSQNVFSVVYYLRTFKLVPGFKTQIRVAHEGKNLILNAEVLRRERISTPAGDLNTVLIKPTISLDGKFSPVGDIFVWLTDDDRKLLVRIESKIKIGKVVGVAKSIEYGKP